MTAPIYTAIEGTIAVAGYQPDGDSVRFIPREPNRLAQLARSSLVKVSRRDGSVHVRLEGIDAPELHYKHARQPLATGARDALLRWLGARDAMLLARSVDTHGRPIAYLTHADARSGRRRVDTDMVRRTANHAMLAAGHAYLLAYTSLPHEHLRLLRAAADEARARRLGVWHEDATRHGVALGELGLRLVFPKLFRRCVDFLSERRSGLAGSFVEWLAEQGGRVCTPHAANVPFASLVRECGTHVALAGDVNELVFVEA